MFAPFAYICTNEIIIIGVVVLGVGVNLLSGLVVAQQWAWLPPAAFVAALLDQIKLTAS